MYFTLCRHDLLWPDRKFIKHRQIENIGMSDLGNSPDEEYTRRNLQRILDRFVITFCDSERIYH